MKPRLLPAFALLLMLQASRAAENEAELALQTVVANEAKFFQLGQEQGTRAAFLQFLAEDSIVFGPGPVNGKQFWTKRPAQGVSITWRPLFAAIASSADFAYTTGPADLRHEKSDAKPFAFSQFVSIWKKQKDGSWKVALDVGSDVPGPLKSEEIPQLEISVSPASTKPIDHALAEKNLRAAEARFAVGAKADSTIALAEAGSANLRVHRENVYPAIGKGAAGVMLSVRRGPLTQERLGGGISAAGDLAYSYGKYLLVRPEQTEHGIYLQIWRTEADGTWKLALDYQTPTK